jgi:hypothetical protein
MQILLSCRLSSGESEISESSDRGDTDSDDKEDSDDDSERRPVVHRVITFSHTKTSEDGQYVSLVLLLVLCCQKDYGAYSSKYDYF